MRIAVRILLIIAAVLWFSSCSKTTSRDEVVIPKIRIDNNNHSAEVIHTYTQMGNFREFIESKMPDNKISFGTIPPNPFGSPHYIKYSLPDSCDVQLRVMTITGVLVDSLLAGIRPPGIYKVSWERYDISNGVYFVKLTACDTTFTTKMTLVR